MSGPTYTSGRWRWTTEPSARPLPYQKLVSENGRTVLSWTIGGSSYGTHWTIANISDADARLIASAPDLLKALKDSIEYLEDATSGWDADDPNPAEHALDNALTAIRKATGGT